MNILDHPCEETENYKLFFDCLAMTKHKVMHRDLVCGCNAFTEMMLLVNHIYQCIGKENMESELKRLISLAGKCPAGNGKKPTVVDNCNCGLMSIFGAEKMLSLYKQLFKKHAGSYTYNDWNAERKKGINIIKDRNQLSKILYHDFTPALSFTKHVKVKEREVITIQEKNEINNKPIEEVYEYVEGADLKAQALAAEQKKREMFEEQKEKLTDLNDEYRKLLNREKEIRNKIANCKRKVKKHNVTSKLTKSKIQLKEQLVLREKLEDKITRCVAGLEKIDKKFDLKSFCKELPSVLQFIYPDEKVLEPVKEENEQVSESSDEDELSEDLEEPPVVVAPPPVKQKKNKAGKKKKQAINPAPMTKPVQVTKMRNKTESSATSSESEDAVSVVSNKSPAKAPIQTQKIPTTAHDVPKYVTPQLRKFSQAPVQQSISPIPQSMPAFAVLRTTRPQSSIIVSTPQPAPVRYQPPVEFLKPVQSFYPQQQMYVHKSFMPSQPPQQPYYLPRGAPIPVRMTMQPHYQTPGPPQYSHRYHAPPGQRMPLNPFSAPFTPVQQNRFNVPPPAVPKYQYAAVSENVAKPISPSSTPPAVSSSNPYLSPLHSNNPFNIHFNPESVPSTNATSSQHGQSVEFGSESQFDDLFSQFKTREEMIAYVQRENRDLIFTENGFVPRR